MTTLYTKDGEIAGFKEIMEWFSELYPGNVFKKYPIACIREMMKMVWKDVETAKTYQKEEEEWRKGNLNGSGTD